METELPVDVSAAEAILQAVPGLVLVVEVTSDGQARVAFANRAFLTLTRQAAGQVVGSRWMPAAGLTGAAGDTPPVVFPLLTPSGEHAIAWTVRPFPCVAATRQYQLWIGQDVTDERQAAVARRRAEALLASVGDNMFDAQLLLSVEADGSFRIRAANRRYLETLRARGFDVTEAQLIGKTRDDLVVELGVRSESRENTRQHYLQAIRTRTAVRYQASFWSAGVLRHVETSVAPIFDEQGTCTHIVRTTRDLTEQVNTERALRVSEARLLEAQTVARIGCWEMQIAEGTVVWTEQVFRLLELDPAVDTPSYERFLEVVHPEDRDLIRRSYQASLDDRLPYHVVHRLLLPDGRIKWVDERCVTEYDASGAAIRSIGTMQDITDRIVAERALGETQSAYRQLDAVSRLKDRAIEASINAIVFTDLEGRIGYVNRSFLRMWGFESDQDVLGRPAWQLYVDQVAAAAALQRLRLGEDWVGELIGRRLDGALFTVLLSATVIRDDRGAPVQLMVSIVDVTARARAEEALRRSEQRYRHLFEQALDGIFIGDADGRLIDVNACGCDMTGYSRAELLQLTVRDLTHPSHELPAFRQLPPGTQDTGEFRWLKRGGQEIQVDLRARKLADGTLLAIVRDVTERRRAEAEARRTRDLLRTVIDSSPDGIFLKDASHRFQLVNEAFAAIAGVRPDDMIGRPDADFWDPRTVEGDDETGARGFRPHDRQALAGAVVRKDHVPLRHADGTLRLFTTVKRPLRDDAGEVYGVLGYTRDVTEQVTADERIRRSLEEKEVLLREIHHRVKNNLQIVSSLLHFQAKRVRNPEDRGAFEDGRKRLLAMILVHDRLYQSEDLSSIEFGMYARSLVAALVATFEQNGRVKVLMQADDLRVPAELALPSGLMLCELVTNVFKYAYPGEMSGTAVVTITRADGRFALSVRDSGVGFPEHFDPRAARTFGWHLVSTLAQQLGATIEAGNEGGACVRITYEIPEQRESPWSHTPTRS